LLKGFTPDQLGNRTPDLLLSGPTPLPLVSWLPNEEYGSYQYYNQEPHHFRYGGLSFGERASISPVNESVLSDSLQRLLVAANGGAAVAGAGNLTLPPVLQDLEAVLATAAAKKSAKVRGR
jgi:hypothetical protein